MNALTKVEKSSFGNVSCDIYSNQKGEFFVTREQIGRALEYSFPNDSIRKIHERHKERLDKVSVSVRLAAGDGKKYETILYTAKGIYEVCRWSQQPKADAFFDYMYDIMEGLRTGFLRLQIEKQSPMWEQARQSGKQLTRQGETDAIQALVGYAVARRKHYKDIYQMCSVRVRDFLEIAYLQVS